MVIHKTLRDFRPLRYSSRDGHAEEEHVNRGRHSNFLSYLTGARYVHPWWRGRFQSCKVGQTLGVSVPLLTCSPSAWPSRLLYRRGRKSRRVLWITLYIFIFNFPVKIKWLDFRCTWILFNCNNSAVSLCTNAHVTWNCGAVATFECILTTHGVTPRINRSTTAKRSSCSVARADQGGGISSSYEYWIHTQWLMRCFVVLIWWTLSLEASF